MDLLYQTLNNFSSNLKVYKKAICRNLKDKFQPIKQNLVIDYKI